MLQKTKTTPPKAWILVCRLFGVLLLGSSAFTIPWGYFHQLDNINDEKQNGDEPFVPGGGLAALDVLNSNLNKVLIKLEAIHQVLLAISCCTLVFAIDILFW